MYVYCSTRNSSSDCQTAIWVSPIPSRELVGSRWNKIVSKYPNSLFHSHHDSTWTYKQSFFLLQYTGSEKMLIYCKLLIYQTGTYIHSQWMRLHAEMYMYEIIHDKYIGIQVHIIIHFKHIKRTSLSCMISILKISTNSSLNLFYKQNWVFYLKRLVLY